MRVLVIGNGFDMDLGLRTSYIDFYENSEFRKNMHVVPGSLEAYLKRGDCNINRWADLEESMARYVKSQTGKIYESIVETDRCFLNELKTTFYEFVIKRWIEIINDLNSKPVKHGIAKRLIEYQNQKKCFEYIYSFNCSNYMDLDLYSDGEIEYLPGVDNIHGMNNVFIFGITKEDCTMEEYSFLVKENQNGYPYDVVRRMKENLFNADEVVIFGHSMNRIDMGYFKAFLQHFSSTNKSQRRLTFITKDDKDMVQIKNNIEKYAEVQINELKKNSVVSFIFTEDYDRNVNQSDMKRFFARIANQ
ncbi:MAG: hypothetical protein IJ902_03190 [Prevotella sp.]|nr:hypothetical protein [Prevotella sp.]